MKMHDPPHPGEVLRALCLEPLNLTVNRRRAISWRKPQGAVERSERARWHQPGDGDPSFNRV